MKTSIAMWAELVDAEKALVKAATGVLPQLRGIVRDQRLSLSDMAVIERVTSAAEVAESARVAYRERTLR